jgi:AraC-like DNA-binding protein
VKFKASLLSDAPLVPIVYARILLRLSCQNLAERRRIVTASQIGEPILDNPEAYISVRQFFHLIDHCQRTDTQPALGARYGMQLDLSAHGLQAFSLLNRHTRTSVTWRAVQFLNARTPLMGLHLISQGQQAMVQLRDIWPLEKRRDFIIDCYLGSMCRIASTLTRRYRVHMQQRPLHLKPAYEEIYGCEVRFGQHSNALVLEKARRERRLAAPGGMQAVSSEAGNEQIITLVRQRIHQSPGRDCTLDRIAESLGSTSRTVSRYLKDAGLLFSDLRNTAREQLARQYLEYSDLSIADIAERLGYSDQASFTKAFRSWTGVPPGQLRRQR